jgi:hypothetical protein
MKYTVVKNNIKAPLKKGTLTDKGRIFKIDDDAEEGHHIMCQGEPIIFHKSEPQPISIQLREKSEWKEPQQTDTKYSGINTQWLAWKKHEDNLKVYDVSDELADYIVANNLTELEEGKDFELLPDLQSWIEGTDTCGRYVAVEIEKRIGSKEAEKMEEALYSVAQDYAVKSHSPNREARRKGFIDGAFWQQEQQEKQFLSDKVNFLLANAMRRLSQGEMILLRDKLSSRLPKEEAVSEDDGLMDIPPPIGDFIMKNATGVMSDNGMLYHYSEVCNLLKRYKDTDKEDI